MNLIARPWHLVFFVGFVAYTAIRGAYARQTKNTVKVHRQLDGLEKFALALVIPASLLLPLAYLFTPLLSFADYDLRDVAGWIGLAAMLLSLWLFWRSHAQLGNNWSVTLEVRQGHDLVTSGVYRYIRHPMYASIFLFSLAQGLLLANWLAGWCALATFTVMYVLRVRREEQMLCRHLGQPYVNYMKSTGRLIPRLGGALVDNSDGRGQE